MTLLAALHSPGGTPHSAAAARISMSRAAAPPLRTYSCDSRMPRLPPVEKLPQTRLRADVLAGGRKFGRDLRPVAFQLLGDELREAGQRALAHLRAGDADHHRVVRPDHDPGVDLRRGVRRRAVPAASAPSNGTRKPSDSPPPIAAEPSEKRAAVERIGCGHRRVMVPPPVTPWRRRGSPRAPADRCRSGRYW